MRTSRRSFTAFATAVVAVALAVSQTVAASGPFLVKDINPGGDSRPYDYTKLGSNVIFVARDGSHGYEIWKTTGTPASTKMVKDINPGGDSSPFSLTKLGNFIYFAANDGSHGYELWRTDGTANGTKM